MNTSLELFKSYSKETINSIDNFKSVNFISCKLSCGEVIETKHSCVELKLKGIHHEFNAYLNLIPGTNDFNCYELINAAKQTGCLNDAEFTSLEIMINEDDFSNDFRINIDLSYT